MVLKLFASRPLDVHDAEGVILRNAANLDWTYIEDQLRPLVEVKGAPEILDTWPACAVKLFGRGRTCGRESVIS